MNVCALVLAAGFSTRMAPHFKPLLPLPLPEGERSALASVCGLYLAEGVQPLVVGGARAEETRREALALGAEFTVNSHPERGMFSSICAGMTALPSGCDHVFVHPVDIPLVRRMTVRTLLDAARTEENAPLIPVYKGQPGHPPLFPATVRDAVLQSSGDGCLRDIVKRFSPVSVPVADSFILRDMDGPEDYAGLRALAPRRNVLLSEEAEELLHVRRVPERGRRHCRVVGEVAAGFAVALNTARAVRGEAPLDPDLARAGGLTHDVCKGEMQHEAAAGRLFRRFDMEEMARLVQDHRDLTLSDDAPITERELVFLADKYVRGSEIVPITERFHSKMERYADDPAAVAAIAGRMERAMRLAGRMACECGRDPENMAREAVLLSCRDCSASSLPEG